MDAIEIDTMNDSSPPEPSSIDSHPIQPGVKDQNSRVRKLMAIWDPSWRLEDNPHIASTNSARIRKKGKAFVAKDADDADAELDEADSERSEESATECGASAIDISGFLDRKRKRIPDGKVATRRGRALNNSKLLHEGQLLHTINLASLYGARNQKVEIKNYKFLASYSWTARKHPTIFVPGAPKQWLPPSLPIQLPSDHGKSFLDQNASRSPSSPFLPFFAALGIMQPSYSLSPVSLVTDCNSLLKLFDIANSHSRADGWRIGVEIVGDTMFLTRWEKTNVVYFGRSSGRDSGYGRQFDHHFLEYEDDSEESTAHYQIVEYELGGIRVVVRSDIDGYLDEVEEGAGFFQGARQGNVAQGSKFDLEVSMQGFAPRSLSSELLAEETLIVIQKGYEVPRESILETKCHKATGASGHTSRHALQCWFSQIKHILMGRHIDGMVQTVDHTNMSEKFALIQDKQQGQLGRMLNLIEDIKVVARRAEGGKCTIISEQKDGRAVVKVFNSCSKGLSLSTEMKQRFWGSNAAGDDDMGI